MDTIFIRNIETPTYIGVPDEERSQLQTLWIDVSCGVASFQTAAATDDLNHTIDYESVTQRVRAVALERPRRLLETLAEELAATLLKKFPMLKVELEIRKKILPDVDFTGVRIERSVK